MIFIPLVGGEVILYGCLHVFQLVENGKHVEKFTENEQIGFGEEIFALLRMTNSLHLSAKSRNRIILK